MMESATKALNVYKTVNREAPILAASPHELIAKLLSGAIDSIAAAKKYIQGKDVVAKSRCITSAIAIIADGLKGCLNLKEGGELAQNLDALYDYMTRRLLEAHAKNDVAILDEVTSLLKEIKLGWDGIKDKA